jgi:hypothetical protein
VAATVRPSASSTGDAAGQAPVEPLPRTAFAPKRQAFTAWESDYVALCRAFVFRRRLDDQQIWMFSRRQHS